jgi:chromosome segregation ATPase
VVGVAEQRDRDELLAAAAEALGQADAAAARARDAADAAHAADAALVERAPRRSRLDVDLLRRLVAVTDALGQSLSRASRGATRFQAPVRARVDAGSSRATELGAELRRLGAAEVELRQSAEAASEAVNTIEVELARLEGEAAEARRRLDDAVSAGAAEAEPEEGEVVGVPRDELAARVTRSARPRQASRSSFARPARGSRA